MAERFDGVGNVSEIFGVRGSTCPQAVGSDAVQVVATLHGIVVNGAQLDGGPDLGCGDPSKGPPFVPVRPRARVRAHGVNLMHKAGGTAHRAQPAIVGSSMVQGGSTVPVLLVVETNRDRVGGEQHCKRKLVLEELPLSPQPDVLAAPWYHCSVLPYS